MRFIGDKLYRYEAFQGYGGTGGKGIYFRGTGEQMPTFGGNKGNTGEQGT